MSATIEGRSEQLLRNKNFCNVATHRPDGTIHGVPVWVDVQDGRPTLNTAEGRAWPRNLERDPRLTLTVQNMENPYEYVESRGRAPRARTWCGRGGGGGCRLRAQSAYARSERPDDDHTTDSDTSRACGSPHVARSTTARPATGARLHCRSACGERGAGRRRGGGAATRPRRGDRRA